MQNVKFGKFITTSWNSPLSWGACVGSDGKESAYNAGDLGSIPGSGGSPGKRNGNPFQYSCLENSMDRGVWRITVYNVAELDMTEVT